MDIQLVKGLHEWVNSMSIKPDLGQRLFHLQGINEIKNGIIKLSESIARAEPYFSKDLFRLKDELFVGPKLNIIALGELLAIVNFLNNKCENPQEDIWAFIHPMITKSSKELHMNGHYANAACDAFIEINSRVKKIFKKVRPNEKIPDGVSVMTCLFSANEPIVEFCDRTNDTGQNTQKGYMQMLAGSMLALRNPKAHENIGLDKDEAFRRLMFASMLMYKIDEGLNYSDIEE